MTRETVLHTLHHGCVKVQVVDISCESCSQIVIFDVERDELFAPSKRDVFTRELLDSWAYKVCAKGSTLKDSFDNWFERKSSITARTNRLGKEKLVWRRQANYAFYVFLNTLSFP